MSPNFYGWNPNSRNLTIPDDGWIGTKWNTSELAKSPYTIPLMAPLFANQNQNLGFYNQGNMFPVYANQGGDFYSGLLNAQANQGGGMMANQSGDMMSSMLLPLIMMLLKMNKTGETDETSESDTLGVKDEAKSSDAGSSEVSADESSASDEKEINFSAKKPLKGLRNFVKNTNDETTYKLDNFETFKTETYKDLEDKSLEKVLGIFGISFKKMNNAEQKNIKDMVDNYKAVTEEEYSAILAKLGFEEGTYLNKKEFNTNKEALVANPKITKANAKEIAELITAKNKPGLITKIKGMNDAELKQMITAFNKNQEGHGKDFVKKDFEGWIKDTLGKDDPTATKEILNRVKKIGNSTTSTSQPVATKNSTQTARDIATLIGRNDSASRTKIYNLIANMPVNEVEAVRTSFNKLYPKDAKNVNTRDDNNGRDFDRWVVANMGHGSTFIQKNIGNKLRYS